MTKFEKTAVFFSVGIILVLIFLIAFSQNGIFDYIGFKKKVAVITEQVQQTVKENQALEHEIQSLKTDIEYIKHIAKHEHDMAEDEELIFKEQAKASVDEKKGGQ